MSPPFWDPLHFWWVVAFAVALDLVLGDPRWLPHPVRGIGWLLNFCEKPARRIKNGIAAGALVLLLIILVSGGTTAVLISLPGGPGVLAAVLLSWAGLALGDLLHAGKKALALIEAGDLDAARAAVGGLVTRSTEDMDAEDLCRTLAESLSENLNDAFVAPFFWLLCAGPVGLWIYKAVSTMDSMWGYKTGAWNHLGRAGARLDDVLAFIPARLTAWFYVIAAPPAGISLSRFRWSAMIRQAGHMDSPNAGWPMATAAWLHGAAMGGPAIYNGVTVQKPHLGPESGQWTAAHARRLLRHTAIAGLFGAVLLWGVAVCVFWCVRP